MSIKIYRTIFWFFTLVLCLIPFIFLFPALWDVFDYLPNDTVGFVILAYTIFMYICYRKIKKSATMPKGFFAEYLYFFFGVRLTERNKESETLESTRAKKGPGHES